MFCSVGPCSRQKMADRARDTIGNRASSSHYLYVRPVAARLRRSRGGATLLLGPLGSRGPLVMPRPLLSRGGPLRVLGYPSLIAILRDVCRARGRSVTAQRDPTRPQQVPYGAAWGSIEDHQGLTGESLLFCGTSRHIPPFSRRSKHRHCSGR